MLLIFLTAFALALAATLLVVRGSTRHLSMRAALDGQMVGPQKFHAAPVPRTGGLGIVLALAGALLLLSYQGHPAAGIGWLLLLCAAPVFGAGLAEDLTKKVGPLARLLASIASALLAAWVLGASLPAMGLPLLDVLLATTVGSVALTAFAVAGMSNAVNIIDGFNGLASMCTVIMLAALAYVAFQAGMPDGIHLHTLIYRRVLRRAVPDRSARAMTLRNSMTAPYLWFVCMLSVIPATLFWSHTMVLMGFLALFVLSYLVLYWRMVRFQSPGWLHVTRRRLLRRPQ